MQWKCVFPRNVCCCAHTIICGHSHTTKRGSGAAAQVSKMHTASVWVSVYLFRFYCMKKNTRFFFVFSIDEESGKESVCRIFVHGDHIKSTYWAVHRCSLLFCFLSFLILLKILVVLCWCWGFARALEKHYLQTSFFTSRLPDSHHPSDSWFSTEEKNWMYFGLEIIKKECHWNAESFYTVPGYKYFILGCTLSFSEQQEQLLLLWCVDYTSQKICLVWSGHEEISGPNRIRTTPGQCGAVS